MNTSMSARHVDCIWRFIEADDTHIRAIIIRIIKRVTQHYLFVVA